MYPHHLDSAEGTLQFEENTHPQYLFMYSEMWVYLMWELPDTQVLGTWGWVSKADPTDEILQSVSQTWARFHVSERFPCNLWKHGSHGSLVESGISSGNCKIMSLYLTMRQHSWNLLSLQFSKTTSPSLSF